MIGLGAYGLTDRGKKRSQNEDQFLIGSLGKPMTFRQTSLSDEMSGGIDRCDRPSARRS